MNTRPATVMASDLKGANWFTSSYSNAGGECVEVADLSMSAHSGIAIRDSKDPNGPALLVSPDGWASFITAVTDGELPAA
ncbi:DUF397 domain-containing protein [Streptomyces sp. NPDC059679]|uniref:DUF397 domain-containing protein n=1 Tax=Streptomyces sp. NPDC059679 TaxID=3346903 RepID=UPI003686FDFE